MPRSDSQYRATKKYNAEHYDRVEFQTPKGVKQIIKSTAKQRGLSVSAYLKSLVENDLGGFAGADAAQNSQTGETDAGVPTGTNLVGDNNNNNNSGF